MEQVRNTESDPDFAKGRDLIVRQDYDEAVEVLGALYGKIVEVQGDLGSGVAPIAFAYGDANLKSGVASNQAWVSNEVRKKQKQEQHNAAAENGAESAVQQQPLAQDDDEEQEEDENIVSREDIEETFEIAFECLDTSRVIYERLISQETDPKDRVILQKRLGEVMMRLGDLKFEQGLFEDAVAEYNRCLETRVQAEESTSRDLASTYHALALTEESIAVDKPNELIHLVHAAKFYSKALEVMRLRRVQILGSDEAGPGAHPSSGSKKKAVKTKNWIPTLTPEQIEIVESACNTSVAVMVPEPSEADTAEAKELTSIVGDLCGKVEDITWLLTEEGKAEQDKAVEEKAKEQTEAAKAGVTTEGFDIPASEQPVTSENVPPATVVSNRENAVTKQVAQPNVLQPRKREKLIPQNSHAPSVT